MNLLGTTRLHYSLSSTSQWACRMTSPPLQNWAESKANRQKPGWWTPHCTTGNPNPQRRFVVHFRQWHCAKAARRRLFITNLWGPFLVRLKAASFHALPKVCSHPVACILSYLPSQWTAHGNQSLHSMWCTQATPHPSIYWSLPDSTKIWEAFYLRCQITIDRLKPATLERDSISLTSDLSISTQRVPYSVPSNPSWPTIQAGHTVHQLPHFNEYVTD